MATRASDTAEHAATPALLGAAGELPVIVRFVGKLRLSTNRVLLCIVIALVAHVPFLPFSHLFSSLFHWGDESESDEDGEALMPLELDLESAGEASKKLYDIDTPPPSTTGTGDATEPPPDAGLPPDAETADAGPPDAAPDAAPDASADAGPDAATPDAGPSPPKDPVADLPVLKQITKNPNNVQIVLVGKRLREHPVGAKMGTLLPTIPQWSAFFDGSGLDPVNDVDVMVITGPRMKVSGQVIAFVQFNIEADRIHAAVDEIRRKTEPEGAWLEDMPLESAHATADRAERVFAVIPEKKLLCVFPWPGPSNKERDKLTEEEKAKSDKDALKKTAQTLKALKALAKSFPDYTKKDYAIDVSMIEPYKLTGTKDGVIKVDMGPLPALSFEPIPRTLKKMHLVVTPKGGDADVKLSFEASDVAQGARDLESLKSVWPLAQTGADMKLGITLPDLDWQQNGTTLEANATLDEASLEKVYALGEKLVDEAKKRRQKKN